MREIVKDAVHGYIDLLDHEIKIIDNPMLQRLRRIYQDTAVHYVYPCATHTRFSHCLGTMHVAGEFTRTVLDRVEGVRKEERDRLVFLMRLWGLLHDVGHGPFSHQFDDIVSIDYRTDHEKIGADICRQILPEKMRPASDIEITREEIAQIIEVKTPDEWPSDEKIGDGNATEQMLYYISFGTYSADTIDYLLRDSYFTGAGYGNVDWRRLMHVSIPLGDKLLLDPKGEEAFDSLLLARLAMFSAVYYHRTTRAAVKEIELFLKEARTKLDFSAYFEDLSKYVELDEHFLLACDILKDCPHRTNLVNRIIPYHKVGPDKVLPIRNVETGDVLPTGAELTENVRNRLKEEVRKKLPEDSFFVDTPIIDTNPVLGDNYVYLFDADSSTKIRAREILETRWGQLSRELRIVRLYVHDRYTE